uniref:Uncharacterized protein n=1 Tax=Ciona savignyi TaxID=51511 RepID=H2Z5C3_CIOSA
MCGDPTDGSTVVGDGCTTVGTKVWSHPRTSSRHRRNDTNSTSSRRGGATEGGTGGSNGSNTGGGGKGAGVRGVNSSWWTVGWSLCYPDRHRRMCRCYTEWGEVGYERGSGANVCACTRSCI